MADAVAPVVSEVALDLCPEKDKPLSHGVPTENWGDVSSFLQSPLCLWQALCLEMAEVAGRFARAMLESRAEGERRLGPVELGCGQLPSLGSSV